jgi:hypothetical protein
MRGIYADQPIADYEALLERGMMLARAGSPSDLTSSETVILLHAAFKKMRELEQRIEALSAKEE